VFFILEQVRGRRVPPPVTHVHDPAAEIRTWIIGTGASVAEGRDRHQVFNFGVTDPQNNHVNIFQDDNKLDRVLLATIISGPVPGGESAMQADRRSELIWKLRFGLLDMGVSFIGLPPLTNVRLLTSIYVEDLTRRELLDKMALIQRAVLFLQWNVQKVYGRGAGGSTSRLQQACPLTS
jgi:hypothetical protein